MSRSEGLAEAAASGDRLATLHALRDRLARECEQASGAAVAALAKQLGAVLKDIEALAKPKEASPVDDLAAQRAARRAKAAGQ